MLVRFLTRDDAVQSKAAASVFEDAAGVNEPVFVSTVVMCELVWVLETAYGYARREVSVALDGLLRAAQLHFADKDLMWQAYGAYREGPGDFADYVMGYDGAAEGFSATVTFDRGLRSSSLFELL